MVSQACASGSSWTAFFCPDSHESGKSFSGALLCTVPADQPDLSPDFISYKLADTGNPSVWLNHYLYRIPMAVWTLRNQKAYKTARNKYDMYIFEGFSVK